MPLRSWWQNHKYLGWCNIGWCVADHSKVYTHFKKCIWEKTPDYKNLSRILNGEIHAPWCFTQGVSLTPTKQTEKVQVIMYQMYVLYHRYISINKRQADAERFCINDHTENTLIPFATMENLQFSELLCSGHVSPMSWPPGACVGTTEEPTDQQLQLLPHRTSW